MKPKTFKIQFEDHRTVFYAGERVRGKVILDLSKPMKMKSLKIFFDGLSKSTFDEVSGKQRHTFKEKESYIVNSNILFGTGVHNEEHPAGFHSYPFSFTIGAGFPSSFQATHGYVRYFCKTTIHRSWNFDLHADHPFTVIRHLDLNTVPNARAPISKEHQATFFFSGGFVSTKLEVNRTGFVPGESVKYDISVHNRSDTEVNKIELELKQCVGYVGIRRTGPKTERKGLVKDETFPILTEPCCIKPNLGTHISTWGKVPDVASTGLLGCDIIDIAYKLVVRIHTELTSLIFECDIIIGTIPVPEGPPSSTGECSARTFLLRPALAPISAEACSPIVSETSHLRPTAPEPGVAPAERPFELPRPQWFRPSAPLSTPSGTRISDQSASGPPPSYAAAVSGIHSVTEENDGQRPHNFEPVDFLLY